MGVVIVALAQSWFIWFLALAFLGAVIGVKLMEWYKESGNE